MNRRESLKVSGLAIGLTLSGATLLNVITSCRRDIAAKVPLQFLNKDEFSFLEELAETILPGTTSPGAKDAGVASFIDLFIAKVYSEDMRNSFKQNLTTLTNQAQSGLHKKLSDSSVEEKTVFVQSLESSGYTPSMSIWGNHVYDGSELPFYKRLKSFILWGYFSSEKVGKEVLLYQLLAPDFKGCIDITSETRLASV